MDVKDFNVSEFVRYVLTGFNLLFFALVLPLVWFDSAVVKEWASDSSFLLGILLSVSLGYLMNILKIYQFTPGFSHNREQFHRDIAEQLEVTSEEASSYFSLITELWDSSSVYNLERRRAEWILALNTAVILMLSIFVWLLLAFMRFLQIGMDATLVLPALAIVVTAVTYVRLLRIATREREKANRDIEIIIDQNRKMILHSFQLQQQMPLRIKTAREKAIRRETVLIYKTVLATWARGCLLVSVRNWEKAWTVPDLADEENERLLPMREK